MGPFLHPDKICPNPQSIPVHLRQHRLFYNLRFSVYNFRENVATFQLEIVDLRGPSPVAAAGYFCSRPG